MRHSTEHRAPRPVRPAAAVVTRYSIQSPSALVISPATVKEAAHA